MCARFLHNLDLADASNAVLKSLAAGNEDLESACNACATFQLCMQHLPMPRAPASTGSKQTVSVPGRVTGSGMESSLVPVKGRVTYDASEMRLCLGLCEAQFWIQSRRLSPVSLHLLRTASVKARQS